MPRKNGYIESWKPKIITSIHNHAIAEMIKDNQSTAALKGSTKHLFRKLRTAYIQNKALKSGLKSTEQPPT